MSHKRNCGCLIADNKDWSVRKGYEVGGYVIDFCNEHNPKRRIEMQRTEKQIERDCRRYAESQGWASFKLTCPGHAGVPDRMFMSHAGRIEFVEFKTEKGQLSPIQTRMISIFKSHGQVVHVIRGLDQFRVTVIE